MTPQNAKTADNEKDKMESKGYISTWEPAIAEQIRLQMSDRTKSDQPYMVALVGIPGGGKSVSSEILANLLEQQGDASVQVTIMPHDGYHIPLQDLERLPNAEDAIYRRGAPDTFDPAALKRDLERIRYGHEDVILVPGFDHAIGDPQPDQHTFDRRCHQIVICEGLYLLHDSDGWQDIANMFDLKIFIESDVDACVERLKIRNLCIPGYTPEEIQIRCEVIDRKNAMTVMKSRYRANTIVQSLTSSTPNRSHNKDDDQPVPTATEIQQTLTMAAPPLQTTAPSLSVC